MKFIDNRAAITVPFEHIPIGECFITPLRWPYQYENGYKVLQC